MRSSGRANRAQKTTRRIRAALDVSPASSRRLLLRHTFDGVPIPRNQARREVITEISNQAQGGLRATLVPARCENGLNSGLPPPRSERPPQCNHFAPDCQTNIPPLIPSRAHRFASRPRCLRRKGRRDHGLPKSSPSGPSCKTLNREPAPTARFLLGDAGPFMNVSPALRARVIRLALMKAASEFVRANLRAQLVFPTLQAVTRIPPLLNACRIFTTPPRWRI